MKTRIFFCQVGESIALNDKMATIQIKSVRECVLDLLLQFFTERVYNAKGISFISSFALFIFMLMMILLISLLKRRKKILSALITYVCFIFVAQIRMS